MTKARIILYSVFAVYHLVSFIFTIVMERSSTVLFKLASKVGWFKYITFVGLALIIADFVWMWMDHRNFKRAQEAARHENNVLKAKVYDLQEAAKPKPEPPKAN